MHNHFQGASYGSLQGQIRDVKLDLPLPRFSLLLPGGQVAVSCIARKSAAVLLQKAAADQKIRVTGLVHYKAHSPAPSYVEVMEIDAIDQDGDFSAWKGAFAPFVLAPWDGEFL